MKNELFLAASLLALSVTSSESSAANQAKRRNTATEEEKPRVLIGSQIFDEMVKTEPFEDTDNWGEDLESIRIRTSCLSQMKLRKEKRKKK